MKDICEVCGMEECLQPQRREMTEGVHISGELARQLLDFVKREISMSSALPHDEGNLLKGCMDELGYLDD